jgi:Zn-dependent peptidase ImmA (M78 family)
MEEKLATCFARSLLMPEEAFRDAISEYGCDEGPDPAILVDVARLFDVSVDAVAWRYSFLLNIGEEQVRRLIVDAKMIRDVRDSDRPGQRPERFRALAVKALHKGEISIVRFDEYVGVSRSQAMRFAEQAETEDEEIAAAPA